MKHNAMSEKKEALVKKRIIDYYESRGISCRDFSRKTGVDETAFYRLDSEMQMKNIVKILRAYPDMDAREILLGEPSVKATPDSKTIRLLPFDAVAGHLSGNLNGDYSETIQLPQFLARGADFAIRVEGDSMTPRFQSGELLREHRELSRLRHPKGGHHGNRHRGRTHRTRLKGIFRLVETLIWKGRTSTPPHGSRRSYGSFLTEGKRTSPDCAESPRHHCHGSCRGSIG